MTENAPLPTNDKERRELKQMLVEITHCFSRADSEREQVKEILKAAQEKTGIDKKQLRKIATTMYKQNYASVQAEHDHFETLYEGIVETKKQDQVTPSANSDGDDDDDTDDQDEE